MSPGLSHPAPPAPARAVHEAELAAAARQFEHDFGKALDDLIGVICFPHSEWWLGHGSAVNADTHQVTASLLPGAGALAGPGAAYQAGTGNTPTLGQLRIRTLVLVIAILKDLPAPTFQRFVDVVLQAPPTVPSTPPLPPARPGAPVAVKIRRETYAQYIRQESSHFADIRRWYLRREVTERFLSTATRFQWGMVTAVHTGTKTATVRWDASDESIGPPTQEVGWGTRVWSRALVGKRVRVARTPQGLWIDDRDRASGGVT